ncbi:MAG: XTP/dITP diphosphatase [Dehalococcoidia bacterium]|jgi:XTP/dITP diphosphohydrolase
MTETKLLLATNNRGKAREFGYLFRGIPYRLVTMADEGITTEIAETGKTFGENAALKATVLTRESGLLTLADDSGLEVDALGGEPGVLSHRYAGDNATDDDRVNFLLKKLEGVPDEKRTARFLCVIAIAAPDGGVELFSGECPGIIATTPRGENGFGYDPVFYVPELGKTMAEIPAEVKNKISHRARAAEKAREYLVNTSNI